MIICHCNVITCGDIRRATSEICLADPYAVLTPGALFRACGARPQCGCCLTRVADLIVEAIGDRDEAA